MPEPRAYHLTAHALEAKAWLGAGRRFALAVEHTLDGHVPYERCVLASLERERRGSPFGTVERVAREWIELDVNPIVQAARTRVEASAVVDIYNRYQASARLAVITRVNAVDSEPMVRLATREVQPGNQDLPASRDANFAILERLMAIADASGRQASARRHRRLSDVARLLGIESSAGAAIASALEEESSLDIPRLARRVGCAVWTLQRQLRAERLTAEGIRSAVRLLSATEMLAGDLSLAEIAAEVGFSDQSHMTRGFKASCGMTPGALREIFRARV